MAWYGTTPAATTSLLIRVPTHNGESIQLTLHLRIATDGRMRATATKSEVTILEAEIAADGTFKAWSPRTHQRTSGTIAEVSWLAALPLIRSEIIDGPVPLSATWKNDWHWTSAGKESVATIRDDGTISGKRLAYDGQTLVIAYRDEQVFDPVRRASRIELTAESPTGEPTTLILIRRLLPLMDQPSEKMQVKIPPEASEVDPDAFIEALGQ